MEFLNGNVRSILLVFTSSGPFDFGGIPFDPIFLEKVLEMERQRTANFHFEFDAYHLLQLKTNWFLQVNGKQPVCVWGGGDSHIKSLPIVHVHELTMTKNSTCYLVTNILSSFAL